METSTMNRLKRLLISSAAVVVALVYAGCSRDEDAQRPNKATAGDSRSKIQPATATSSTDLPLATNKNKNS